MNQYTEAIFIGNTMINNYQRYHLHVLNKQRLLNLMIPSLHVISML